MMKKGKSLLTGSAKSRTSSLTSSQTRTYLKGTVTAKRVVIPASEVESKTDIHPLNPRNQEALTLDAVRDIFPSICENGVNQEGVAVRCPTTGKLLLLDASRRRFSCINGGVDLPLWELQEDVRDDQMLGIINDSQEVKRWSYPEHARYLLTIAERQGIDVENTKVEDLAAALSIGRESLRKRLEANNVELSMRKVFVDFEGIPNSFYSKLAKHQRALIKAGKEIDKSMAEFKKNLTGLSKDVSESQRETLDLLESFVVENTTGKPKKATWETNKLAEFDDKNAYAKVSRSADRNMVKFEFSRIGSEKMNKIDSYIKRVLSGDE